MTEYNAFDYRTEKNILLNTAKRLDVPADCVNMALILTALFRIKPESVSLSLPESMENVKISFLPHESFEKLLDRLKPHFKNHMLCKSSGLYQVTYGVCDAEESIRFAENYKIQIEEEKLHIAVPGNLHEYWYRCFGEVMEDVLALFNKNELVHYIYDKLPDHQLQVRQMVNNTKKEDNDELLYNYFVNMVNKYSDKIALYENRMDRIDSLTYLQLKDKALELSNYLISLGIKQGDRIVISMPKGIDQIIAVFAVLFSGATYVPVGFKYPEKRKTSIIRQAAVTCVLLNEESYELFPKAEYIKYVNINKIEKNCTHYGIRTCAVSDIAYVIFTSGTTGEPKGIEIQHNAAWNTVHDVINRLNITCKDIGIAISELDFDLSVFDIFGVLSVGGRLVLIGEEDKKEAAKWCDLISEYKVSFWNSVPALFEMLLITADNSSIQSIKTVIVSGDWVRPKLYNMAQEKIDSLNFVAMGGATEASIWSNYYCVNDISSEWNSIPYGKPLSNQAFRIVDKYGRECVDYQDGELQITGKGLAKGYINNPKLTSEKFILSKCARWYATGDIGRYLPDGNIEFRGRMDNQVKLRGYRIELEEITKSLQDYSEIQDAISLMLNVNKKDRIVSAITLKECSKDRNERVNFNVEELKVAISDKLPEYMLPDMIEVFDSFPLNQNGKIDQRQVKEMLLNHMTKEKFIENNNDDLTESEQFIKKEWEKLLFIDTVSKEQNFFEVGGDSLLATKFITIIKERYSVELTLGEMFDNPRIGDIAVLIEQKSMVNTDNLETGEI